MAKSIFQLANEVQSLLLLVEIYHNQFFLPNKKALVNIHLKKKQKKIPRACQNKLISLTFFYLLAALCRLHYAVQTPVIQPSSPPKFSCICGMMHSSSFYFNYILFSLKKLIEMFAIMSVRMIIDIDKEQPHLLVSQLFVYFIVNKFTLQKYRL